MSHRRTPTSHSIAAHIASWLGLLLLSVHLVHGVAHAHRSVHAPKVGATALTMQDAACPGGHHGIACPLAQVPFSGLAPCLPAPPQVAAPVIFAAECPEADRLLPRRTRGRPALPRAPPLA